VVGALPAQPVVHLDAGYDYQPCRQALAAARDHLLAQALNRATADPEASAITCHALGRQHRRRLFPICRAGHYDPNPN
jgi:hypothetical protein